VASAETGLDGIRVGIDGVDIHGETDVNGVFSVVGRYFGPTTLRFDRQEDDLHAQVVLNVPNGASVFLRNVTLGDSTGRAIAETEDLTFDGIVVDKECLRKQIQVVSRYDAEGQSYVVDLTDSVVTDASGESLPCRQLRKGEEALVQGLVQPDGSIGSSNVTVYDEEPMAETTSSSLDAMESASAAPEAPPPSPAP
jgi:hypothetical protein